jgi:hypothetical protein
MSRLPDVLLAVSGIIGWIAFIVVARFAWSFERDLRRERREPKPETGRPEPTRPNPSKPQRRGSGA